MKILALETSCDETGAAVVVSRSEIPLRGKKNIIKPVEVLSNITATSSNLHAKTGGIIPEHASRQQVKAIIPTIVEALLASENIKLKSWDKKYTAASKILEDKIDAIAITSGPGLIGSLIVGVETAKTLSFSLNKPIVPVNHLLAHIFANFIQDTKYKIPNTKPNFPFVGLIVSGGHTDLLLFKTLTDYKWLGGTRDDAAGEALDKIGRLLNLSYPAGPEIEHRASIIHHPTSIIQHPSSIIQFQSPMLYSKDFDFSFSGLKAEVARFVKSNPKNQDPRTKNEICYAVQKAIVDVLVKKTIRAAEMFKVDTILLGGGVSANENLRSELERQANSDLRRAKILAPQKVYATDNAAMIGAYALLNYKPVDWHKITAQPDLYFA